MDVLVIGAGAAGMNAALWSARLGLSVRVLEAATRPGGQLLGHASTGDWTLGQRGVAPAELAARFAADLADLPGLSLQTGQPVTRLALDARPGLRAHLADGTSLLARAVILATGLRPRDLPATRIAGTRTRVMLGAGDARLAGALDGPLGILGAGDNAHEVALLLAARGHAVEILHRNPPRATPRFQALVAAEPRIRLQRISGDYAVRGDETGVSVMSDGHERRYAHLALLLGYEPQTGVLRDSGIPFSDSALAADGFVQVDDAQRTAVARLYAAGDVTGRPYSGLPMALGQGAVAAKTCALDLAKLP